MKYIEIYNVISMFISFSSPEGTTVVANSLHQRALDILDTQMDWIPPMNIITDDHLVGGEWLPFFAFSQKYWECHHPN